MLINACNIVSIQLYENILVAVYFRPSVIFLPANSCPMFVAFLEVQIQSALHQLYVVNPYPPDFTVIVIL